METLFVTIHRRFFGPNVDSRVYFKMNGTAVLLFPGEARRLAVWLNDAADRAERMQNHD